MSRINGTALAVAALVVVLVGALLAFTGGSGQRTVTAYFSRAVSVYQGSDVDVMGVRIGRVTAVVPEGDKVRVEMEYDPKYQLPAGVKAAIITPTLVADRFVQLAPAYGGGPALRDGGDIPLQRTAVPVELDQIYRSLADLTAALGPNGANKDGSLNQLLAAGDKALKGNGQLGNEMLKNLSAAAETFGNNSGPLFQTVENLAGLTATLQANDKTVGGFMTRLADVSQELSGERGDLQEALAALARAIGTVRSFVHDNKGALVEDVKQLSTTIGALASQKDTLATLVQLAPLGLGNLAEANDPKTGTVGIRLQLPPTVNGIGAVLCGALKADLGPSGAATAKAGCQLLSALLPFNPGDGSTSTGLPSLTSGAPTSGAAPASSLTDLVGGLTGGTS